MKLSVVTANLFKENTNAEHDIELLMSTGAFAIGLGEAQNFIADIKRLGDLNGYRLYGEDIGGGGTSILLVDDIANVRIKQKRISDAVGDAPNRIATCAKFTYRGEKFAVLNVHFNAKVQNTEDWSQPLDNPSVEEFITGSLITARWVNRMREKGRKVILMGDMNWAYMTHGQPWKFAPQSIFSNKCGLVCQFDQKVLARKKGDARPVEYIFWHPEDFSYAGQSFVGPESSDHPFHETTLISN